MSDTKKFGPVADLDDIIRVWERGEKIEYLVLWGYDDVWTEYKGDAPPNRQGGRLAWRVSSSERRS